MSNAYNFEGLLEFSMLFHYSLKQNHSPVLIDELLQLLLKFLFLDLVDF